MSLLGDFFDRAKQDARWIARDNAKAVMYAIVALVGMTIWWVRSRADRAATDTPAFRNYAVVSQSAMRSVRDAAFAYCTASYEARDLAANEAVALASVKLASDALSESAHPLHRKVRARFDTALQGVRTRFGEYVKTCDPAQALELDEHLDALEVELDIARNPTGMVSGGGS